MVTMEEGGHISATLLTHIRYGLDDIGSHVGRDHGHELQLIAIGIPEGGLGIIAEIRLYHIASHVTVFSVDITAQHRPEESAIECTVEESLLTLCASFHLDMRQDVLPGVVGF